MAEHLFEQVFVSFDGCRYRLQNVEAVHLKRVAFRACRQGSWLQARINEKGVAGDAGRQRKGDGNESGIQVKTGQERTSGDVYAREDGTAQEAKVKSDKRGETRADCGGR
jgi:hypothetical protein